MLAAGVVSAPAQAQAPVGAGIGTGPIGPITEHYGFFPEFYTDGIGRQLQLCIDPNDATCLIALPNPALPQSFPSNFLEEGFYWTAGAEANGATLIMAQEATFDGIDGNQAVFGRLRVRIRNIPAGRYRFTTPYGQFEAVTDGQTDVGTDVGCGPVIGAPCNPVTFQASSGSALGPNFLSNVTDPIRLGAAGTAPLLAGPAGGVSFSSNPALIDKVGPGHLADGSRGEQRTGRRRHDRRRLQPLGRGRHRRHPAGDLYADPGSPPGRPDVEHDVHVV